MPGGAVSMQPHPHTAQSHPSPRYTHTFREVRTPLEPPLEGRSSTELQWGLTAALGPGIHWICPQGVTDPA